MSQDYLAREDQRRVSSQEQARLKMNVQEEGDTDGEQRLDDDIAILERKDGIEVQVNQIEVKAAGMGEEPCVVKGIPSGNQSDSGDKAGGMTRWRTEAGTIDSLSNRRTLGDGGVYN